MSWLSRIKEGITTTTREKKEAPDGIWYKCNSCKETITAKEHIENQYVCPLCNYHDRISPDQYFSVIFDEDQIGEVLFDELKPVDFLHFTDLKSYEKRIVENEKKTGEKDAMKVARGMVNGMELLIAAMDFRFIGGSMGSVVGEKISRSVDFCIEKRIPLLIISKSGGARMMESAFSLMQMAKTASKLSLLAKEKLPYLSLMTDPTTGGVTASFAMLGDINMAEPGALIGFAGPRVIKETIKRDLPDGFQRSEFLMDHGFLDLIVDRKDLKEKISELLMLLTR